MPPAQGAHVSGLFAFACPWCNLGAPNEAFLQRCPQSRDMPIKRSTHRTLQWQVRRAIWFSLSTRRNCSHTALPFTQALTFMWESDERNELLTKKLLRALRDIFLFLKNPSCRADTFAYLSTTLSSRKLSQNLLWPLRLWRSYHVERSHTIMTGRCGIMNQAASLWRDLHCRYRKWMTIDRTEVETDFTLRWLLRPKLRWAGLSILVLLKNNAGLRG